MLLEFLQLCCTMHLHVYNYYVFYNVEFVSTVLLYLTKLVCVLGACAVRNFGVEPTSLPTYN